MTQDHALLFSRRASASSNLSVCFVFSLFQCESLLFLSTVILQHHLKRHLCAIFRDTYPSCPISVSTSCSYCSVFSCHKYWQMECTIASKNQQLVNPSPWGTNCQRSFSALCGDKCEYWCLGLSLKTCYEMKLCSARFGDHRKKFSDRIRHVLLSIF